MGTLEDIEDATSEHVLLWACRVEVQRIQKSALDDIKEAKDFENVRQNIQKQDHGIFKMHKNKDKCKYSAQGIPSTVPFICQEM